MGYNKGYYLKNKKKHWEQVRASRLRHPEKRKEHLRNYAYGLAGRFKSFVNGAKTRGLIFEFTKQEFEKFKDRPCFYCGDICFGLDRLDSTKGYIKNNVVSCCGKCNWMKGSLSKEDFINQCKKIKERQNIWVE